MDLSRESNHKTSFGHKVRPLKNSLVKSWGLSQFQLRLLDHRRTHCSFIEEVICKVPGSLRIHPSLWSKEDVIQWLRWAEEEYSLSKTDDSKFVLNGRALCILTKEDFKTRSPNSGDVLYELLRCIMNHRQGLLSHPELFQKVIRTYDHPHTQSCIKETSKSSSKVTDTATSEGIHQDVPLNLCQRLHRTPEEQQPQKYGNAVDGRIKDCRLLWDYLYHLLDDKRYESFIKWEDKDSRVFRVVDPNKLASLWGNHKNRPNMTYEKMSRALRQYYKTNLLKKESGQKLTFRFLRSPKERLTSEKLRQLEAGDTLDSQEDVMAVSPQCLSLT
ncbi:transcription factor ETV7-like [Hyperolius riggenbachi]|uniref:transcription factor ETV7-like n=1 Tax=Hyperolius riggenbachi TaxID=752182 RepID=UPI0035A26EBF